MILRKKNARRRPCGPGKENHHDNTFFDEIQIEFLDRGGASQEHRGGPWAPINLKGQGTFSQQFQRATVRNTAAKTMDA
jgi:hypothetical protein